MASLNVQNGVRTFNINGDESQSISFNPCDRAFLTRLEDAFTKAQAVYTKLETDISADGTDWEKRIVQLDNAEQKIRTLIDGAFGSPVCGVVFGNSSALDLVDSVPVWVNFIVAVLEECDKGITAMKKNRNVTNPRIEKLMKKYGGKRK